MNISFDKHKIIKWSGSAAKLLAIAQVILFADLVIRFLSGISSLPTEVRNANIINMISAFITTLLGSMVFWGYSMLVTEFLDKKDEKRS